MNVTIRPRMRYSPGVRERALKASGMIADWLCNMQTPMIEMLSDAGRLNNQIDEVGVVSPGSQWNTAFAIMGWLSSCKATGNERYKEAALGAGRFLKTLQIFNPFTKRHYGAIREKTPQTPWCYPRDAASAAWAFIELYRFTGDDEWLERAVMFGEWFFREAFDEFDWPVACMFFGDPIETRGQANTYDDVQGCFHGGSMNFFIQLAQATGDYSWTGDRLVRMADFFVNRIQQDSGIFVSLNRSTGMPPTRDPQNGLHRANDDLGTLALLGMYRLTGEARYLESIKRFVAAVFDRQDEHGMFEESVACIPVVLNVIHECGDLLDVPAATDSACERALCALLDAQELRARNPMAYGGIIERPMTKGPVSVCTRSSCYALIYLLKEFAGVKDYLKA